MNLPQIPASMILVLAFAGVFLLAELKSQGQRHPLIKTATLLIALAAILFASQTFIPTAIHKILSGIMWGVYFLIIAGLMIIVPDDTERAVSSGYQTPVLCPDSVKRVSAVALNIGFAVLGLYLVITNLSVLFS